LLKLFTKQAQQKFSKEQFMFDLFNFLILLTIYVKFQFLHNILNPINIIFIYLFIYFQYLVFYYLNVLMLEFTLKYCFLIYLIVFTYYPFNHYIIYSCFIYTKSLNRSINFLSLEIDLLCYFYIKHLIISFKVFLIYLILLNPSILFYHF